MAYARLPAPPTLERAASVLSGPARVVENAAPAVDVAKLRESLAGDLDRAAQQGEALFVDMWDPFLAYAVPHETLLDVDDRPWMRRDDARPPCRMGSRCQGHALAMLLDAPHGTFVLPIFETPDGRSFGFLCILCLRLVATRDGWRPFRNMRPFQLGNFSYGDGCIREE